MLLINRLMPPIYRLMIINQMANLVSVARILLFTYILWHESIVVFCGTNLIVYILWHGSYCFQCGTTLVWFSVARILLLIFCGTNLIGSQPASSQRASHWDFIEPFFIEFNLWREQAIENVYLYESHRRKPGWRFTAGLKHTEPRWIGVTLAREDSW